MNVRFVVALVAFALVAGVVAVLAFKWVGPDGPWTGDTYDDAEGLVEDWCDNVAEALSGANGGATSFRELMHLGRSGLLEEPAGPSSTEPSDLSDWEADHADFAASSFLAMLGGYPGQVSIAHAAFVDSMRAAHAGEPIPNYSTAESAVRQIDAFRARTCPQT